MRPRRGGAPVPLLGSGLMRDYANGYEPIYYGMAPSTAFAQQQPVQRLYEGGEGGSFDMPSAPPVGDGTDLSSTDLGAYMSGAILGSPAVGLLNFVPFGSMAAQAMADSMQDYGLNQQVSALQGAQDTFGSGGSVAPSVIGALGLASGFNQDPANTAYSPSAPASDQGTTVGAGIPGIDSLSVMGDVSGTGAPNAPSGMVSLGGVDTSSGFSGDPGGGDGGDGGGKIICTAMNHAYGFGSYRNAIWLKYSAQHMTKAHEVGYHALFLPLVKYAFHSGDGLGNRVVRRVLEHGTRRRTADLRAEMRGTKRDALGRFYRLIFEPVCYLVGKAKGY